MTGASGCALGAICRIRTGGFSGLATTGIVIVFEIRRVPATAGQLEIWRRHLFGKGLLLALRARLHIRGGHFAHQLLLITTFATLKIVDRHISMRPRGQLAEINELAQIIPDSH